MIRPQVEKLRRKPPTDLDRKTDELLRRCDALLHGDYLFVSPATSVEFSKDAATDPMPPDPMALDEEDILERARRFEDDDIVAILLDRLHRLRAG